MRLNSLIDNLESLRNAMKKNSIDAYIIPLSDPHINETVPDHWNIVQWLTGFTGSSATLIVTDSFAGLWTDSRYYLQAKEQLSGSSFKLILPENKRNSDYTDWSSENIKQESRIGFDGRIFSVRGYRELKKKMEVKAIKYEENCDLISEIWKDRPEIPVSQARDHPLTFSGKERSRKISEVRDQMNKSNVNHHLLTSPDDIMWLLNIRGNDLKYSPVLFSFSLISQKEIALFIDDKKIPGWLHDEFRKLDITIHPYTEVTTSLASINAGSSILITPDSISVALFNAIPGKVRIMEDTSIPSRIKSVKNKTEIRNISDVMVKDGVALTKLLFRIDCNNGQIPMTETGLSSKLEEFRQQQEGFLSTSFPSIVAFNEHAALPHFETVSESGSVPAETGILLVDSGGQYYGGTTDITRTVIIGIPTPQQKKDFTLVLKGHIALASAKFPAGTKGYQLDILARKALWENGLNYGHGTGHGVGYCLNVHEGPQNIGPSANKTAIEAGMLISNEPAVYREGEYGIRIENLMICYEDEETEFGQFLKFDTVSLCYIDKRLIDRSLLNREEIDWLNSYHTEVFQKLAPHLSPEEKQWLREKAETI